jgi:chromosome segregation ATPase
VEVDDEQDSREVDQDINSTGNASYGSYGSVEGVGGDPGCSSREVELENKVSELRYQLVRLGEEKVELERNLAGSEELAQTLATELEGSQKVMVNMSSSFHRGEVVNEETEQVKEVQEQCCSLTLKVEDLTRELQEKDDKLLDMEVMMVSAKEEIEECKIREELMNKKLVEKFKKCSVMEAEIKEKIDQVNIERTAREDAEGKLEVTQVKLQLL